MSVNSPRSIDEIRKRKKAEEAAKDADEKLHEAMAQESNQRANQLKQNCASYCGFHPLKPLDFSKAFGRFCDWVCHQLAGSDVSIRHQHTVIVNMQVEIILLKRALKAAGLVIETRESLMPNPTKEEPTTNGQTQDQPPSEDGSGQAPGPG